MKQNQILPGKNLAGIEPGQNDVVIPHEDAPTQIIYHTLSSNPLTTSSKQNLTYRMSMLAKLEELIGEVGDINSKLILVVGLSRSGKTQLLRQLGAKLNIEPLNVGLELGRRLASTPNNERGFLAGELFREIAKKKRVDDPLLLDNLELMFEPGLNINPLDLIRRLAHSKRVVAVWPGELHVDRLTYSDRSHPEHRDYSSDGVVVLEI